MITYDGPFIVEARSLRRRWSAEAKILYCYHCRRHTLHDAEAVTLAGRQVVVYVCQRCQIERTAEVSE